MAQTAASAHAPFLSVAVVTFLYEVGALVVHFMLGQHAPAGAVFRDVWPSIVLNLILTAPVYALARAGVASQGGETPSLYARCCLHTS